MIAFKHLKAGTRSSFVSSKYYRKDHNNQPIKPDANCSVGKLASEQQCFFCQPSSGKPNNCSQKSYKTKSLLVLILCQLFASYSFHYGNSNLPELLLNFRKEEEGETYPKITFLSVLLIFI